MANTSVFISYRRSDSSAATGRIADRLQQHFGDDRIFFDVDTIPLGINFKTYVGERLDKTDVFLVVIGDGWLDATDADGNRRIDDPADNVHVEVAAALARGEGDVPVIPVLVGQSTSPPTEEELPAPLRELASRNAIPLRSDTTFEGQINRLIQYIEARSGGASAEAGPALEPVQEPEPLPPPETSKSRGRGTAIGAAVLVLVLAWFLFSDSGTEENDPTFDQSRTAAQSDPSIEPSVPFATAREPEPPVSQSPAVSAGQVRMPDVVGSPLSDAQAVLGPLGLEVEWSYSANQNLPDSLLRVGTTDPPTDSMVRAGDRVTLHMYYEDQGGAQQTEPAYGLRIPNLAGRSLSEAQAVLDELGVAYTWMYSPNDDLPDSRLHVTTTDPPIGTVLPGGAELTLHLRYE